MHLRCSEIFNDYLTKNVTERIFNIGEHLVFSQRRETIPAVHDDLS